MPYVAILKDGREKNVRGGSHKVARKNAANRYCQSLSRVEFRDEPVGNSSNHHEPKNKKRKKEKRRERGFDPQRKKKRTKK